MERQINPSNRQNELARPKTTEILKNAQNTYIKEMRSQPSNWVLSNIGCQLAHRWAEGKIKYLIVGVLQPCRQSESENGQLRFCRHFVQFCLDDFSRDDLLAKEKRNKNVIGLGWKSDIKATFSCASINSKWLVQFSAPSQRQVVFLNAYANKITDLVGSAIAGHGDIIFRTVITAAALSNASTACAHTTVFNLKFLSSNRLIALRQPAWCLTTGEIVCQWR